MTTDKNATRHYIVAGHRFSVTAGEEYLRLMDNYEPFSASGPSVSDGKVFELTIGHDPVPPYAEELIQDDGEQKITCGVTADGRHVFVFSWLGVTAGTLICSDIYREGKLVVTGQFRKLAVDNALMIMYALATARERTALFHAAVVSNGGKGYMFLGPSGTGKSTHARLWLENIPATALLNDDNPVVRIGGDGVARVYGSPWSGKTPCYRNADYPLGGIVLLSQAPYNAIHRLSGIRAYSALLPAISGKRWDRRNADGLHATENTLASTVAVWHLQCLPDRAAAETCHSAVTSIP